MQPTYFKKRGFALTRRFRAPVAAVWSANRPVDTSALVDAQAEAVIERVQALLPPLPR